MCQIVTPHAPQHRSKASADSAPQPLCARTTTGMTQDAPDRKIG